MQISLKAEGLEETMRAVEALASDMEIREVNKRIFQRSADITEPRMKKHMARSADNTKSGKQGYRPPGHASDNIPKKATAQKAEIGWELNGDAENWFYMKFVEWGTTKQPPRDFLQNTRQESEADYSRIAEEEYQNFIDKKVGD